MQGRNRALNIVRDETGASLIFVLGIMLLLMAIGVSALTAAGASAGEAVKRQTSNQLALYTDSMHKSLKYALEPSLDDMSYDVCAQYVSNRPKTLSGQILGRAYTEFISTGTGSFDLNLSPTVTGIDTSVYTSIRIIVESHVLLTEYRAPIPEVWSVPEDEDEEPVLISEAVPRVPQSASISGTVSVMVTALYEGRTMTSVAEYEFFGAELSDDDVSDPFDGRMFIDNSGDWRLISYEKVERQSA